jgi:hypothetical protein
MDLDFNTVDSICSKVNLDADHPNIDLSRITFSKPFGLIYLGMFLRHLSTRGKACTITPPRRAAATDYLAKQNFWNRFNVNPATLSPADLINNFPNSTSLNDIIDIDKRQAPDIAEDIANKIKRVLRRCDARVNSETVEEIVVELVDNYACHSTTNLAAIAMQYYPVNHRVVIAIGDCGIGIRASLTKNPVYHGLANQEHYTAALQAFEPIVSCKPEGGMGLTEVKDNIIELNGQVIPCQLK